MCAPAGSFGVYVFELGPELGTGSVDVANRYTRLVAVGQQLVRHGRAVSPTASTTRILSMSRWPRANPASHVTADYLGNQLKDREGSKAHGDLVAERGDNRLRIKRG